ncbi:hypothetical protein Adt_21335 [Abeliophyllum distichum]|uniref:Uncharacterized protein n=1 Tax=Abeliophyllum distichum TaxID=126358 RepID=A0ABD1SZ42_9LAMI
MAAKKDKQLAKVKEKIERVKPDHVDAEARAVAVYQDRFEDTPECKDLTHHFMRAGGEQLVERIVEIHPEWDILFLRHPLQKFSSSVEPQGIGKAQTLAPNTGESPQCIDPSVAAGH